MNTSLGQFNPLAIAFFLLFVISSLGITYWAAKRTRNTAMFYTAGGNITGFQNGQAKASDFMSAASFLGIAGLVALKVEILKHSTALFPLKTQD